MAVARYSASSPCPVCAGHPKMQQGQGTRCFGFLSGDGDGWCICTREGGGRARWHDAAQGWSHRVTGDCPCGTTHGADTAPLPPPRRPAAEVRELGEARRAEIVATYDYTDKAGRLLFQVVRFAPKTFRQRRPHPGRPGEWVWKLAADPDSGLPNQPLTLYRIPEVIAGLLAGDTVWIVEGEKDVEAMRAAGCVATCNAGGAGKWRPEFASLFAQHVQPGGAIRIIEDADPDVDANGRPHRRGQQHARAVYDSIRAAVPESVAVSILRAAAGKDAADHLEAGHGPEQFIQIWPEDAAALASSPAEFKRAILRRAATMSESALQVAADAAAPPENPPRFLSPLKGDRLLSHLQGVVTVAGGPSAGKSYFAIGCAVDNAMAVEPWEVFYLSCEMGRDYVLDRVLRAVASHTSTYWECSSPQHRADCVAQLTDMRVPERFTLVDVGIGVTMEQVIGFLAENVTDLPTLVVLDSISSLVDNMEDVRGDSFGMTNLKNVQRYATAVRRLTRGHVSWLILSELNREGRAKGRSLDHRSDLAISMTANPDNGLVKEIRVTKSWFCPTGTLGEFVIQPELARLVRVEEPR